MQIAPGVNANGSGLMRHGYTIVFILNPEESGSYRFVQEMRLFASREIGHRCRTRHKEIVSSIDSRRGFSNC